MERVLSGLMAEDGGRTSGMFHTMSEDDVRLVMKQPWVAIASDGSAINLDAPGVPHPRNSSTNVRVLGYYVRNQHVLRPEDAVRKMTSLPAQILGLRDRGQIREGFAADIAIVDPNTVGETNSFEKPNGEVSPKPSEGRRDRQGSRTVPCSREAGRRRNGWPTRPMRRGGTRSTYDRFRPRQQDRPANGRSPPTAADHPCGRVTDARSFYQ